MEGKSARRVSHPRRGASAGSPGERRETGPAAGTRRGVSIDVVVAGGVTLETQPLDERDQEDPEQQARDHDQNPPVRRVLAICSSQNTLGHDESARTHVVTVAANPVDLAVPDFRLGRAPAVSVCMERRSGVYPVGLVRARGESAGEDVSSRLHPVRDDRTADRRLPRRSSPTALWSLPRRLGPPGEQPGRGVAQRAQPDTSDDPDPKTGRADRQTASSEICVDTAWAHRWLGRTCEGRL